MGIFRAEMTAEAVEHRGESDIEVVGVGGSIRGGGQQVVAGGVGRGFAAADPEYRHLSSSLIKEVAGLGGDISGLVPDRVLDQLTTRLAERKANSD
ncbi:hypothetical protein ACIRRA_43800 [Nocardia sp. NPDC101769]|uniref:hypothetical protein n=1 Tax=Nocardia sp. NPDC101769 TaxID=3364333 RepID=UPI00381ADE30